MSTSQPGKEPNWVTLVSSGDLKGLQEWIDTGGDVNARDENGATPLIWAAGRRNLTMYDFLRKAGASITAQDAKGWSVLHYLAAWGNVDRAETVLDDGLDVNDATMDGNTPLKLAAYYGKELMARLLVCHGAKAGTGENAAANLARSQGHDHLAVYLESGRCDEEALSGLRTAEKLNQSLLKSHQAGKYEKAIELGKQAVRLRASFLDEFHPDYAQSLGNLAEMYRAQGLYDDAEPLYMQAIKIWLKTKGANHLEYATSLNNLAAFFYSQGRYNDAVPRYEEALEITRDNLGTEHPSYATSLNNLAAAYYAQGNYSKAEPLYRQSMEIRRRVHGELHPTYASSLNNLAELYKSQGRVTEAKKLYEQVIEIKRNTQGIDHPSYATSLSNLAGLYASLGDYEQAESFYKEAKKIHRKALGKEHPSYAMTLNNLAGVYESQGRYSDGETLLKEVMEIWRNTIGTEHPNYAASLNGLAKLYRAQGRYSEAVTLYKQALEIFKKSPGKEHPSYATMLCNLAGVHRSQGHHREAEPFFLEALEIRRKSLGEKHPDFAESLNNLAGLYESQGRYREAEPYFLQAQEILGNVYGEEHPDYATSVINLAGLYRAQSRYREAEPLYNKATKIRRKILGDKHPDFAAAVNNLAVLFELQGRFSDAEPLYAQASEILRNALGETHADYATSLNNLAGLFESQGRPDKAEPFYKQAKEIWRNALGEEHPLFATSLSNLALLLANPQAPSFNLDTSKELLLQAGKIITQHIERTLPGLAFSQQRDFLAGLPAQGSPLLSMEWADGAFAAPYSHLIRWKGLLLQTLRQQINLLRLGQNPAYAKLVASLQAVRAELVALAQRRGGISRNELQSRIDSTSSEKEALEQKLASVLPEDAFSDTLADVGLEGFQQHLGSRQAFVDIHRHNYWHDGKVVGIRYSAVLTIGAQPIKCIDLGAATRLESLLSSWRDEVMMGGFGEESWHELVRLLWQPVVSSLPDSIKGVWVSPDGQLARLPWNLLAEDDAGTKTLPVSVIGSARELLPLLKPKANTTKQSSLLLVGDLDFDAFQSDHTLSEPNYPPLKGTKTEVEALDRLAKSHSLSVTTLRKHEAVPDVLSDAMPRSRYVHLATHGFFFGESRESYGRSQRDILLRPQITERHSSRNPLVESGIALSGANVRNADTYQPLGLLTAEEMLGLDLKETELVVLSACNTARGTEVTGQGVMGLQAAIMTAGAESLLMSLWKVPDEATAQLMEVFYKKLWDEELEKGEALRQAQAAVRKDHPAPVNWAAWTLAGKSW